MKPGLFCKTKQTLSLGIYVNKNGEINPKQKLSCIWKYNTYGLIVSVIHWRNHMSLFIIQSNGTGWITFGYADYNHVFLNY
jgi:hypothetical protein